MLVEAAGRMLAGEVVRIPVEGVRSWTEAGAGRMLRKPVEAVDRSLVEGVHIVDHTVVHSLVEEAVVDLHNQVEAVGRNQEPVGELVGRRQEQWEAEFDHRERSVD